MTKIEIINGVTEKLLEQRGVLTEELAGINFNEPSFFEKRIMLQGEIANTDMQIMNMITSIPEK